MGYTSGTIRPLAICLFRSGDRILVGHGFDRIKNQHYRRPVGGAIEFGERAEEALRREIREELGMEIEAPRLLGVLENLFTYEGTPGHEIVFVFDARLADAASYERGEMQVEEGGWSERATWERPADLAAAGLPLYPDGLATLLSSCR